MASPDLARAFILAKSLWKSRDVVRMSDILTDIPHSVKVLNVEPQPCPDPDVPSTARAHPGVCPQNRWCISPYPGSDPAPLEAPIDDPRIGVHSFTPDNVTLAYWRPGITFWCSVPCRGSHRPLAMQVPADEIATSLRQQPLASNR